MLNNLKKMVGRWSQLLHFVITVFFPYVDTHTYTHILTKEYLKGKQIMFLTDFNEFHAPDTMNKVSTPISS